MKLVLAVVLVVVLCSVQAKKSKSKSKDSKSSSKSSGGRNGRRNGDLWKACKADTQYAYSDEHQDVTEVRYAGCPEDVRVVTFHGRA